MCVLPEAALSFLSSLRSIGRHMLHRVLLQYWQKVQSGQGFFFRINFFITVIILAYIIHVMHKFGYNERDASWI